MILSSERGCHLFAPVIQGIGKERRCSILELFMKKREKGIELAFSVCSCQTVSLRLNITARLCTLSSMFWSAGRLGRSWKAPTMWQTVKVGVGCQVVTSAGWFKHPAFLWKATWDVYGAKLSDRILVETSALYRD